MTPPVYWSIAWAIGIWLSSHLAFPPYAWAGGALVAILIAILIHPYRTRLLLSCLAALALGALRFTLSEPHHDAGSLAYYNEREEVALVGTVADEPDVRGSFVFYKLDAHTLELSDGAESLNVSGAARVRGPRFPVYDYGDRLQVHGRLETPPILEDFNYRDYLANQRIYSQVPWAEIERLSSGGGSVWKRAMLALKGRAQATIGRILPGPEASLLTGILLGNEGGIAPDMKAAFQQTGASHVIAISGFNISIVGGLIVTSFGRLLSNRRLGAGIGILGVALYTVLVGADAAVVRAAIMGGITLLGLIVGRPGLALNSLAVTVLAMTAADPDLLWDVGFQLSLTATLGLILYAKPLEQVTQRWLAKRFSAERAARIVGWLSDVLLLTFAAQIWTTPLILRHFGRLSLVSLLTNALILPIQPLVMVCGGVATLAGLLFQPLGAMLGWVAYLPLTWTIRVVEETARFPHASTPFSLSDGGLVAAYGLIVAFTLLGAVEPDQRRALWQRLRPRIPVTAALGGLALLNLAAWLAVLQLPDGKLHVTFLDVGQGDAILIETPAGAQILIDGGPNGSVLLSELGRQMPFWDRSLDLVVLTHPDGDHLTGLVAALERYDVGAVLTGAQLTATGLVDTWEAALQAQGVSRVRGEAGVRLELSDGVALEILHPTSDWTAEEPEQTNNQSLVLRLTYRDVAILLPGDIEADVERTLLRSGAYLASTVLKLPHHGSKTSSSRAFLDAVNPQVAVISVGAENDFGHPSREVLERLGDTLLYRTDCHGRVSIASDGHALWIETER